MAAKRRAARGSAAGRRLSRGRTAQPGRVQRGITSAITGGEMITVGVLNVVRTTLTTTRQGVADVGAEIGSAGVAAVRGSIRAAARIGEDLGLVSKGAVNGVITATEDIGGDLASVARSVTQGAVRTTAEVGGDVARTARKAVEGAIEAAGEVGGDAVSLARSAAAGAIEAADRIGGAAGRAVRNTLGGTVAGVQNLISTSSAPSSDSGTRGPRIPPKTRAKSRSRRPRPT